MYPLSSKTPSIYTDIIIETNEYVRLKKQETMVDRLVFDNIVLFNRIPGVTPICRFSKRFNDFSTERYYHTSGSVDWLNYVLIANDLGLNTLDSIRKQVTQLMEKQYGTFAYLNQDYYQLSDIYHGKGHFFAHGLNSSETNAKKFNHALQSALNDVLKVTVETLEQTSLFDKVRNSFLNLLRQERKPNDPLR